MKNDFIIDRFQYDNMFLGNSKHSGNRKQSCVSERRRGGGHCSGAVSLSCGAWKIIFQ